MAAIIGHKAHKHHMFTMLLAHFLISLSVSLSFFLSLYEHSFVKYCKKVFKCSFSPTKYYFLFFFLAIYATLPGFSPCKIAFIASISFIWNCISVLFLLFQVYWYWNRIKFRIEIQVPKQEVNDCFSLQKKKKKIFGIIEGIFQFQVLLGDLTKS